MYEVDDTYPSFENEPANQLRIIHGSSHLLHDFHILQVHIRSGQRIWFSKQQKL